MTRDTSDLESRLDQVWSGVSAGPPALLMHRVRSRRRRRVLARAGGAAAMLIIAVGVALLIRTGPAGIVRPGTVAPGGGGARGMPAVANGGPAFGRGMNAPGPAAAPVIRVGDGPGSDAVRALLDA